MRTLYCFAALLAFSIHSSAQWSKDPALNLKLSDGAGDEVQAKLRTGGAGYSYISWYDSDPAGSPAFGYDVRLQRVDPAGNEQWAAGGVLIADRGFSSTQDYGLDAGPEGAGFLAFRDDRFVGTQITATKVDANGAQLWGATGVQLTNTGAFVASPKIAATSDGACVVAWTEGSSIRLQRLSPAGAPLWGAGITLPVPGGTTFSLSDLRASDAGRVIFSFISQTGGFFGPRHLVAAKLETTGAGLWGAGVPIYTAGSLQIGNFPSFETDGGGGAVFSWYSTGLQCFAQRVLANGSVAFPVNGSALSNAGLRERVSPHATYSPATQETFVFWTELAVAQSQRGLYGQKLDSLGNVQWGAEGIGFVPVSASTDVGFARTQVIDNTVAALWFESSGGFGTDNVRALHADTAGALLQPISSIATTASSMDDLAVDVGPFGDVHAAWHDNRAGDNDVYAQNVRLDGGVGPAAGSLTRTAGTNVDSYTAVVGPLGGQLQLEVDLSTTGYPFAFFSMYVAPSAVPFGSDVILVDLFAPGGNLLKLGLKLGPLVQLSPTIPNDPSLCGLALYSQVWHVDPVLPLRLSNAVDIFIGL